MLRATATIAALLLLSVHALWAQPSPGLQSAVVRSDLSALQDISQKGAPGGYAPLDGQGLLPITYWLPGFAAASGGSVWYKSGSTVLPLGGFASDGITNSGIRIGTISAGVFGLQALTPAQNLMLRAGDSGGKVLVASGQTLGSASNAWSVSSSGAFLLASGSLSGNLALGGNDITGVDTIGGTGFTLNLTTPGITLPAGDFTFVLAVGKGVVIPGTAARTTPLTKSYALNVNSADALYTRTTEAYTWMGIQTFSQVPVFSAGITQASVTGLVSGLAGKLSLSGGTMTGGIAMGGTHRVTGLANPVNAQDAATKAWADATFTPLGSVLTSVVAGNGIAASTAAGAATVSLSVSPAISGTPQITGANAIGLDMNNKRISEVANPVSSQDAVNLQHLASELGPITDAIVSPTIEILWVPVTSNITASLTGRRYMVDTRSAPVTITLPASPVIGMTFQFLDAWKAWDNNVFTVLRNGQLIEGAANDITSATEGASFELVYIDASIGWRLVWH